MWHTRTECVETTFRAQGTRCTHTLVHQCVVGASVQTSPTFLNIETLLTILRSRHHRSKGFRVKIEIQILLPPSLYIIKGRTSVKYFVLNYKSSSPHPLKPINYIPFSTYCSRTSSLAPDTKILSYQPSSVLMPTNILSFTNWILIRQTVKLCFFYFKYLQIIKTFIENGFKQNSVYLRMYIIFKFTYHRYML